MPLLLLRKLDVVENTTTDFNTCDAVDASCTHILRRSAIRTRLFCICNTVRGHNAIMNMSINLDLHNTLNQSRINVLEINSMERNRNIKYSLNLLILFLPSSILRGYELGQFPIESDNEHDHR